MGSNFSPGLSEPRGEVLGPQQASHNLGDGMRRGGTKDTGTPGPNPRYSCGDKKGDRHRDTHPGTARHPLNNLHPNGLLQGRPWQRRGSMCRACPQQLVNSNQLALARARHALQLVAQNGPLVRAAERPGPGRLVLPGSLTVDGCKTCLSAAQAAGSSASCSGPMAQNRSESQVPSWCRDTILCKTSHTRQSQA